MAKKPLKEYESYRRAKKRYDKKTYKNVGVNLRFSDDADVLAALDEAKQDGIPYREVLADWYHAYREAQDAKNADSSEGNDILGVIPTLMQLTTADEFHRLADDGFVDRITKEITSDSRTQMIVTEYVESELDREE